MNLIWMMMTQAMVHDLMRVCVKRHLKKMMSMLTLIWCLIIFMMLPNLRVLRSRHFLLRMVVCVLNATYEKENEGIVVIEEKPKYGNTYAFGCLWCHLKQPCHPDCYKTLLSWCWSMSKRFRHGLVWVNLAYFTNSWAW